jgi:hypothetical protein
MPVSSVERIRSVAVTGSPVSAAVNLSSAQPDPDLGDPHRDCHQRDRIEPHAQRVARRQIAQLRGVLGVWRLGERGDAGDRDGGTRRGDEAIAPL